jgi:predicted RNA-binding protein (virulence factor B family)
MKIEEVEVYKFEDRGYGYCVIFEDGSWNFNANKRREIVLNGESLAARIINLKKQGLPTSFEEWAHERVMELDGLIVLRNILKCVLPLSQ